MTVLVLGATGFIGSWTVRALAPGVRTVALVRPGGDTWRIDGVAGLEVMAADPDRWGDEILQLRPATVVSLDWSGVAGSHRDDAAQWRNLDRLRSVLAASAAAGVRRVVGVGSQAEYGPRDERIAESAPTSPVTEYGRAKLAASELVRDTCAAAGLESVWARVFSTYGPLDHGHWLLPQIAAALLAGRPVDLSPGTQTWSYLYGADAGDAMAILATAPTAAGIVNVGHPDARVLRDTVEDFARHLPAGELRFGAIPLVPTAVTRLEPDVAKLTSLGWAPSTPLDIGLERTARWLAGGRVDDPGRPGAPLPSPLAG